MRDVSPEELELRHPQNGGHYRQKDKQTWVRFYYNPLKVKNKYLMLQVSKDLTWTDLVYQVRLRDKPHVWRNRLVGQFFWRLGVLNEEGSVEGFTKPYSFTINQRAGIPESVKPMSLSSKTSPTALKKIQPADLRSSWSSKNPKLSGS